MGPVSTGSTRWRTFADAVAMALGLNVWISLVLVPGFYVSAWNTLGTSLASLLPVPILGAGIWRRSEPLLLFGFPASLLLPLALAPEIAGDHVYGPARLLLVGAGLIAYLFSASIFTFFSEPTPPAGQRRLSSARKPLPTRWKRRFRVYRWLVSFSVLFPLALFYAINFHEPNQAFLRQMFPGRAATLAVLINLGCLGFWVLLFLKVWMGALRPHRTGDRDLQQRLLRLRADAQSGRPSAAFYVGVATAVLLLALLLLWRT